MCGSESACLYVWWRQAGGVWLCGPAKASGPCVAISVARPLHLRSGVGATLQGGLTIEARLKLVKYIGQVICKSMA